MSYRPYPNVERSRRQVVRGAPAPARIAMSPAVADVLRSLTQMGAMIRQAYTRTNLHRAVIEFPPRGAVRPKPTITFQEATPNASRHWNTTCGAPNYSDRCELTAGHEGRHKDGYMSWSQGVKRPVEPARSEARSG